MNTEINKQNQSDENIAEFKVTKQRKYHLIREAIAKLANQQIELKPQRKTVHFTGERTIDAGNAQYNVQQNKSVLMHLHIAYAQMRGKELPKPKRKLVLSELVKQYVKDFTPAETEEEKVA